MATTSDGIAYREDCDECCGTVHPDSLEIFLCQGHYKALKARIAELESGINLPGWWCTAIRESGVSCDTFNGESKEKQAVCRNCEKPKKTS